MSTVNLPLLGLTLLIFVLLMLMIYYDRIATRLNSLVQRLRRREK